MLATSGRTLEISNTVGHQCFANLRQRKNGQTPSSIGVDYSIAFCALLLGERVHVDRVVVVNRQHRHRGEQMSSANESLSTSIPASSRPDRSLCWHHVYWTRLEHKRRRWRRRFVSIDNSLVWFASAQQTRRIRSSSKELFLFADSADVVATLIAPSTATAVRMRRTCTTVIQRVVFHLHGRVYLWLRRRIATRPAKK